MSATPPTDKSDNSVVVARRAGIIAVGTLASRILGAARDMVIAATFATHFTDAFWVAFTIPNALRVLLGEGAVSGAFVPVLTQVRERGGPEAARVFYARLVGAMLLVLLFVSVVGSLLAPWLVPLYASGFRDDPALFDRTVSLTRILFPYIGLAGAAALVMGALHASKRFAAASFAPAMLNVGLIAATLILAPMLEEASIESVYALAVGALLGGLLHIFFQLPSLKKSGLLVRPRLKKDPDVRRAFLLLAPLLIALGVYQLNIVASRQLASYLEVGAVSFLFYGQRLVEIPQGMFALAIGSAALPTLSEHAARGELDEAKALFSRSLSLSLFVAIPSTVGLAVLAGPFVATLFGRGEFGVFEVEQTTRSLVFLAAGIWAVASVRTIVPMFHSLGDTRSPVIASAINVAVFFTVSIATMGSMGHVGLALAITVAAAVQLAALLLLLRRKVGTLGFRALASRFARAALASAAMGAALFGITGLHAFSQQSSFIDALWLVGSVIVGAFVFAISAKILRSPELDVVLGVVRRRVKR